MKAITTKYYGPTNTRGSKIIASDGDNRIQLHWDDSLNSDENHVAAAKAFCAKLNWKGKMATGWTKDAAVHVFVTDWTTFEVIGKDEKAA